MNNDIHHFLFIICFMAVFGALVQWADDKRNDEFRSPDDHDENSYS